LKAANPLSFNAIFHITTRQHDKICAQMQVYYLNIPTNKLLIVSDATIAKHILYTNAANHNKGLLTELLDFVMGSGLITANGETAVTRRREIAPGFHMWVPLASSNHLPPVYCCGTLASPRCSW
jgi:hypothetical protein